MPVNFDTTNLASSSSRLGKRSRANCSDDADSDSTDSLRSLSPETNATDDNFRTALGVLRTLRNEDDAAMDALLEAVREQQKQLDSLRSIVFDTHQKRRQDLAGLQEVVEGLKRRHRKSRSSKRRVSVQDSCQSLELTLPNNNNSNKNKDLSNFRKNANGLVSTPNAGSGAAGGIEKDPMDLDIMDKSTKTDAPITAAVAGPSKTTVPAHLKGKAKRTPQHKAMFAPTNETSAQPPSGSAVRKARGLREQSPKDYYKPISLPGDEDDDESLYSNPFRSGPNHLRTPSTNKDREKLSRSPKSPLLGKAPPSAATANVGADKGDTSPSKDPSSGASAAELPTPNRSVNPWQLTPSQTRERNAEVITKALNRERNSNSTANASTITPTKSPFQTSNLRQQVISFATINKQPSTEGSKSSSGNGNGYGTRLKADYDGNTLMPTHYEADSSSDIIADLNNFFPPEWMPTYKTIPQDQKIFSRPTLARLLGGRMDSVVKLGPNSKRKYNISQYLAFRMTKNPQLPAKAGSHGVVYVCREDSSMDVGDTCPLFVSEAGRVWIYFGNYKICEAVPLGRSEWDNFSRRNKDYWVKSISESGWGHEYLRKYGVKDASPENVLRLLNASGSEANIRLQRRVLRFVGYDREFYDAIVAGSEELERSEQVAPINNSGDTTKYSQREFVPSGAHDSEDESDDSFHQAGEEDESMVDDVIPW